MSGEIAEDAVVSIPVREVLAEQTSLLREIDRKVDGKADKADLAPIVTELRGLGGRVQTIEDERRAEKATKDAHRSTRRTVAWVVAAIMVPFGSTLLYVFH